MSELEQAAIEAIDVLKMCIYERPENYLAIDAVNALENALAQQLNGWQPIETAPKDIDVLLLCKKRGCVRGRWNADMYAKKPRPYWTNDREYVWGIVETRKDQPTHWMPLPTPPEFKK